MSGVSIFENEDGSRKKRERVMLRKVYTRDTQRTPKFAERRSSRRMIVLRSKWNFQFRVFNSSRTGIEVRVRRNKFRAISPITYTSYLRTIFRMLQLRLNYVCVGIHVINRAVVGGQCNKVGRTHIFLVYCGKGRFPLDRDEKKKQIP